MALYGVQQRMKPMTRIEVSWKKIIRIFCTVLILDGTFSVILSVIVTPFQVVFVILSTTSSSC